MRQRRKTTHRPQFGHSRDGHFRPFSGVVGVTATALALLALLVAGLSAGAQIAQNPGALSDQAGASDVFSEVIDVEVINIDVYVTDDKGRPVQGLTADDFELRIDKREAPISNFYAVTSQIDQVRAGVELTEEERRLLGENPEAEAPEEVEDDRDKEPPPPDQRLHVVIYIDNYNLTPFKRNRVLSELRQFLRSELSEHDQVMLATYDRSLHLRQPFTYRPERISRALMELEDISAQRVHLDRERIEVIRRIEDADSVGEATMYARNLAGSIRNDLHFTIDALRSIVDNLGGATGRKAVVYVSEGLPMIAGEDLFYAVQQKFKEQMSLNLLSEYNLNRRFEELANQANANRVSFYTIDARGLTVLSQGTVDYDIKGQAGERGYFDHLNNSNLQSTVQLLAERTGGRAIINANRYLPDLRKVASDFRNYYSLGYMPGESGDGRLHDIQVQLKDKPRGWNVRYRDTYRSKSVETRMHDGTMSALHLDLQHNPLGAQILIGKPQPTSGGLYNVPLAVQVPIEQLALIPREGTHHGKLTLWFAAKDEKDEMSDVAQIPVDVELPSDMIDQLIAEKKGYTYKLDLTMEAGYQDVAIGLRDEIGARNSFVRRGVRIGPPGSGRRGP